MIAPKRPVILCTRPSGGSDPLVSALQDAGYRTRAVPTVDLEPGDSSALERQLRSLRPEDWVVLTSVTGARQVIDALLRSGAGNAGKMDVRPSLRWAAVGPATADELSRGGIRPQVVPEDASGAALPDALLADGPLTGRRVLLPRADAADDRLPAALRAGGAEVHEVVAYRTVEAPTASLRPLAAALADQELAAAVIASGSAFRGLVGLARRLPPASGACERLETLALVSIGPTTSDAIRAGGLRVAAQATRPSVADLVRAVASVVSIDSRPTEKETDH